MIRMNGYPKTSGSIATDSGNFPPEENRVYFIGAGPGSPKYLTLEGREALEASKYVYAVNPYRETFETFIAGKEVRDPFRFTFSEITLDIGRFLDMGSVAFLIPGDMAVFSPFLPLVEYFRERSRVIAGVGILNAAAALLGRTLDMPGVSHVVVQTSPKHVNRESDEGELERLASLRGTMVLYMNNRPLSRLTEELGAGYPPETPVTVVYRIGLDGQKIYRGKLETIARVVGDDDIFGLESGEPSMAIIMVGDVLQAVSDPDYWDRRKKQFWDRQWKTD